jgi:hypothetical protein
VPGAGWAAAGMLWLVLTPAVTMLRRRDGGSPTEAGIASAFVLVAAGLWTLFLARGWWADEVLLTNPRLVAGLATAAALVLARRTKALADFEESTRALAWAAAGLGFVVGLFEVHEAVTTFASTPWRSPLVSVYATLYAAGLLAVGFRTGARHLRMLALLAFAGVVAKVGLHDLAAFETPYRILITACLGVVLLLAAYAYARRERRLPPHPGAQAERIEEAA